MYQIKMFNYQGQDLENDINRWLQSHPRIELVDIKYKPSEDGDLAMIIYRN